MFLKNRNIISKIKRSKVTDYAALRGHRLKFLCFGVYMTMKVILTKKTLQTLMKCSIMLLFIFVLTVYQSTHLVVSSIQTDKVEVVYVSHVIFKL